MKQMRSRFRLITLLLVCAFVLTLAVCAGSVLKASGITLASLPRLPVIGATPSPGPSVSPDASPSDEATPAPSEAPSDGTVLPGTDISPDPEYNDYNVFGL